MYITICDECGPKSGIKASTKQHSHCVECNKLLNPNYSIKCNTCNHINIVKTFNELKNGGCVNCKYPLNWNITANPSIRSIFVPNFITLKSRITSVTISLVLIVYSVYGLIHDKIDLPYGGKYSPKFIAHFHGNWKLIPLLGIFVLITSLLSTLIDHYDKRPNEKFYQTFSFYCFWIVIFVYFFAQFFASSATRL